MNEACHYVSVITAEVMAAVVLAIIMFAIIIDKEHRKSTNYLFIAIVIEFVFLICDALSYYNMSIGSLPNWLMCITYFISYTFGLLVLIPFCYYSKAYIEESSKIKNWVYLVPVVLVSIALVWTIISIALGKVYGIVDGKVLEINGAPRIVSLIQIINIIYLPVVAFSKRKDISWRAVLLLGFFGLLPAVLIIVSYNFTGVGAAVALVLVYMLVQSDYAMEKEKRNKKLEELNSLLEESNEENVSIIEEVRALNDQLQDNQAKLEEAASEQESQLEEISELNKQLNVAKDQAEDADRAKTSFLFSMSHDIRTPMNAIIGFRDLLEKHQDDPIKRADYLKKIEEASNVLLSIINNVLEMARIEKGTIEIDESTWSVEQFNDTLYSIFHEMMKQKGIIFTRNIDVINHYVYCDPIKLREVFINILSNAYKYTNSGGSVTMNVKEIDSDREGYALYQTTITDTGVGMSEEFIPHLFEEFARENHSIENKIEGTGLGMSIVKRLLEFMDGTIEVQSKKGEGTSFIVTIPHRIADRSSLVSKSSTKVDETIFKGKRILLAEDNDFNAEIAIEILKEADIVVERAEDGMICYDMLNKADDNYYDLILMDIQMPNMNGYDATKAIRKMKNEAKANIPIVAMTANAFEEDKRQAIHSGMNGHLVKPVNVNDLFKLLSGILK